MTGYYNHDTLEDQLKYFKKIENDVNETLSTIARKLGLELKDLPNVIKWKVCFMALGYDETQMPMCLHGISIDEFIKTGTL